MSAGDYMRERNERARRDGYSDHQLNRTKCPKCGDMVRIVPAGPTGTPGEMSACCKLRVAKGGMGFEYTPPSADERLAAFDAKWRPKIAHTLPPDASVGYMAWCLLYVDQDGKSPDLTVSELAEAASDLLELNGAVNSQVESQARRVIALLRY